MAMIVNDTFTQQVRRDSIRLLSGRIDEFTISDEELEIIAERADTFMFDSVSQFTWTGLEPNFPELISGSNCMTAVEILRGIGGSINDAMAKSLSDKVKDIIKTMNGVTEEQVKPVVNKTGGINNQAGTFG